MQLEHAQKIANAIMGQLAPHCDRIEIAGSVRRKRPWVKDIEIVCIPKPYETGLFESGIASVVNQWKKKKGELPCKNTQRYIPVRTQNGTTHIVLDLFLVKPENWGLQLAIRTGSAKYSHLVLATGWKKRGYTSVNGILTQRGKQYPVYEEKDLFERIGLPYVLPENREV
ncbi:MAG: hypothetical protein AAGF96_18745 [Bacteroidota bacterium]